MHYFNFYRVRSFRFKNLQHYHRIRPLSLFPRSSKVSLEQRNTWFDNHKRVQSECIICTSNAQLKVSSVRLSELIIVVYRYYGKLENKIKYSVAKSIWLVDETVSITILRERRKREDSERNVTFHENYRRSHIIKII